LCEWSCKWVVVWVVCVWPSAAAKAVVAVG
jgi:hypothetical protein